MLQLYTYWRSSASYRVRIALGIKRLEFISHSVHLMRGGGEQHSAAFRKVNPQGRVPALIEPDGRIITQSLAIMEYLEETRPQPPLLPEDAAGRARVRALAQIIACDIQPLQNTSTTNYLRAHFAADSEQIKGWMAEFIGKGLAAVEEQLAEAGSTGRFCHGDAPGLADCCLVPQCYAARRFGIEVDAARFANVARIDSACRQLPAFQNAAPQEQPDRE